MTKENHDTFILNKKYPEAAAIFQFSLKSLDEIKDDCYVVLDTNVLLMPYTVNRKSIEEIRDRYFELIESKRLVIPGQVAREFAENRVKKIAELHKQLLDKKSKESSAKLEPYPLLESMSEFKEALEISSEIEPLINKYKDKLGAILDNIKNWIWNDPISEMYRTLFSTDVVVDLQINGEEEEIEKDLDYRYNHKIPPGYKDSSKDDKGVGDLLIWKTILDIAQKHSKSVIFVSNDAKPDWWHQSDKKPLYTRYELVDEFRRASNQQSFHIVTFSRFLELYGASKDVINDVRHEEQVDFTINYKKAQPFKIQRATNYFNYDINCGDSYILYLKLLSRKEQDKEICQKIENTYQQIIDTTEFADKISETNAFDWDIDSYKVTNINIDNEECTMLLAFIASGSQDANQIFSGNKITGKAEVIIDELGEVTYQITHVEVDNWGEDEG